MTEATDTLRAKLGEVLDVRAALAVLEWDQEVNMPPKGAEARGEQIATLSALAHRLFTHEDVGRLLEDLRAAADTLPEDDRSLVSETLYDYERATRLPEAFVQKLAAERSKAFNAWRKAREESDFAAFSPNLEGLIDLLRQKADMMGYEGSPYNALLEEFERGMTAEQLRVIFGELAPRQRDLVRRIQEKGAQPNIAWLDRAWPEAGQWDFSLEVLRDMGFDFEAGRQDKSPHPFTTNFDIHDVRVTTRIAPRNPLTGLSGSIHEGGHALYEQGFLERDRRTLLAAAPSLGIHESQSRMWENIIGRSRPFWEHYVGVMQAYFPGAMDGVSPEQVYRAMNIVKPSLIRVDADECTYNLHVILRFELEVDLMEGALAVADIPEAWNAKIRDYLDIEVPNDAQGCLQDVHWAHAAVGYFPSYALGNLYAAQLIEAIQKEIPELWSHVAAGKFGALLEWLRVHVHQVGRRKLAPEIVRDATGAAPTAEPYLGYLEQKFGDLYSL